MIEGTDSTRIRSEVESILEKYGVAPTAHELQLNPDDTVLVRQIALRIIYGDFNSEELTTLGDRLGAEIGHMVQWLMGLKNSDSVRDLEELNPYYSVFQPKVIRDR